MSKVTVDFNNIIGQIKPMHAVNNGPATLAGCCSNYEYFKEAGIPFVRTHDSAYLPHYGGEATVDVHRIFTNFDADENDPKSYKFDFTDIYLKNIASVNAKTFYRLGASIEHQRKVGTVAPKDFLKWAKICEHIIMHYTEGWADGFHYDIEYWEIWNEPDCRYGADGPSSCWTGTDEQFYEFFTVVFKHLKARFPHLKIGGPAIASLWSPWLVKDMIKTIKDEKLKLDFFSFHRYAKTPGDFLCDIDEAVRLMKECNNEDAELILNEWNYVKQWDGEGFEYSIRTIKNHKGAAFTASVMAVCQYSPLYMLMYYDARPCAFNGMFDTDYRFPLKGYYPFKMFNELYRMGNSVEVNSDDENNVFVVAACDDEKSGAMVVYYTDKDDMPDKDVKLEFKDGAEKYDFYLVDEFHTDELMGEVKSGDTVTLKPNSVAYFKSK